MRGTAVLGDLEQEIDPRQPETVLTAVFPTSKFLSAGAITTRAGVYELDEIGGGVAGRDLASIDLQNPRQGTRRPPRVDVRRLAGDPTIHVEGKPLAGMTFLLATVGG